MESKLYLVDFKGLSEHNSVLVSPDKHYTIKYTHHITIMADLEAKFDQLLNNFSTLQSSISVIGTDVKSLGDRFSLLESRTTAAEKRLDTVETSTVALEINTNNAKASISNLNNSVAEAKQTEEFISQKYDQVLKQSNENKAAIANLVNNLTNVTKENITLKTMIAGY